MVSANTTTTTITGLVPDNVVLVRFTPATGAAIKAKVEDNFYVLSIRATGPSARVKAPLGYRGPSTIPGPPMPVAGKLQWFDRNGDVIGPAVTAAPPR